MTSETRQRLRNYIEVNIQTDFMSQIDCDSRQISEMFEDDNWEFVVEERDLSKREKIYTKSDNPTRKVLVRRDNKLYKVAPNVIDNTDLLLKDCIDRDNYIIYTPEYIDNYFNIEATNYQRAFSNWNQSWTSNIKYRYNKFMLIEYWEDYVPLQLSDLISNNHRLRGMLDIDVSIDELKESAKKHPVYIDIVRKIENLSEQNNFIDTDIYTHYTTKDVRKFNFIEPYTTKDNMTVTMVGGPILNLDDLTDIAVLKSPEGIIEDWKIIEPNLQIQPQHISTRSV